MPIKDLDPELVSFVESLDIDSLTAKQNTINSDTAYDLLVKLWQATHDVDDSDKMTNSVLVAQILVEACRAKVRDVLISSSGDSTTSKNTKLHEYLAGKLQLAKQQGLKSGSSSSPATSSFALMSVVKPPAKTLTPMQKMLGEQFSGLLTERNVVYAAVLFVVLFIYAGIEYNPCCSSLPEFGH